MGSGRPAQGSRKTAGRPSRGKRLRDPVVTLDAEDIALARLQAHLRKTEAVHAPSGVGRPPRGRTTISLPLELLRRVRDRARREGVSLSRIVEAALGRHLNPR